MHTPHIWFFDYFWLLCGVWCGVGGALSLRFRLRSSIAAGAFTYDEVNWFAARMAICILLPCTFLWVLQMSIGAESTPFFFMWPQPQFEVALAIQVCVWAGLLYWVFLRGGAVTASKVLSAASRRRSFVHTPIIIKAEAIAVVLAGVIALLLAPRA